MSTIIARRTCQVLNIRSCAASAMDDESDAALRFHRALHQSGLPIVPVLTVTIPKLFVKHVMKTENIHFGSRTVDGVERPAIFDRKL